MRLIVVGVFLLLTGHTLQECSGESNYRKLANDVKLAAEKFALDVKLGAVDVAHGLFGKDFGANVKHVADKLSDEVKNAATGSGDILKKYGIDVEKVAKVFRHDVSLAWVKVKPYMTEAFTYIDGVMKRLENVENPSGLRDTLKDSVEKLKNRFKNYF